MGNLASSEHKPSAAHEGEEIRAQANEHYQQRNKCYEQSREAYSRRDYAAAKLLSQEAKRHEAHGKVLNEQAADAIFRANNAARGRSGGEVDLHGLHVAEAIAHADEAIRQAKAQGRTSIVLIVGKGRHSADGVPKIKPAVMQLVDKYNLRCRPDVPNEGCILVEFVSAKDRGWFADWGCIVC